MTHKETKSRLDVYDNLEIPLADTLDFLHKVILVHAPEMFSTVPLFSPLTVHEHLEKEQENIEMLKNMFSSKMRELRVKGEFMQVDGEKAGQAVVRMAQRTKASFVVTAYSGRSSVWGAFMGSVSDYIMHNSPIPVLVVSSKAVSLINSRPNP